MFGTRKYSIIAKTERQTITDIVKCLEKQFGPEGQNWMCYSDRDYTDALIIEFRDEKFLTLFRMAISPKIKFYDTVLELKEEEAEYARMKYDMLQMKSRMERDLEEYNRSMSYEEYLNRKY